MSSPPWSPCYPLCNKLWQVKATALNKNCDPRSRKTENITASTLTCIRGEKKSLTRVYELVWNTIKSAPQPMKCHGDKGRLSPSQRRRVAYIRVGARASLHRAEQSRAEWSGAERSGAARRDAAPSACALRGPVFLWKSLISRAIDSRWDRVEFATGIIYRLSIAPPNLWVRKRA